MKKLWTLLAVCCACLPLATGCAVDSEPPPPTTTQLPPIDDDQDDTQNNEDDIVTGTCDAGDVRSCKIQINERNCFVGEQVCEAGTWSDCLDAVN